MPEKTSILADIAFWVNLVIGLGAGAVSLFVKSLAQQLKSIVEKFEGRDEEMDRQLERLRNDIIELYNMDRSQATDISAIRIQLAQFAERLDNLLAEHRRIHK